MNNQCSICKKQYKVNCKWSSCKLTKLQERTKNDK